MQSGNQNCFLPASLMPRILTACTFVTIIGMYLTSTIPAAAQSTMRDKWVQLLTYSLAASVPPISISVEDGGAYRTQDLTKKKYIGDGVTLSVVGETERYAYDQDSNRFGSVKRFFAYVAKYSDFDTVSLKSASNFSSQIPGVDYTDTAVVIYCSARRSCVEHTVKGQDCNAVLLKETNCRGPVTTDTVKTSYMTLILADQATAKDAKEAIEELIRINTPYDGLCRVHRLQS